MPLTHPFYFSQPEVSKKIYTFHKKLQATSATMTIRKVLLKNKRNNGDTTVTKINTDKKYIYFSSLFPLLHSHHDHSHIYSKANRAIILALVPKLGQRLFSQFHVGDSSDEGRPSGWLHFVFIQEHVGDSSGDGKLSS